MNYRSLLVPLDDSPECDNRTQVAIRLASEGDVHLIGLAATGVLELPDASPGAGWMTEYAARTWDELRDRTEHTAPVYNHMGLYAFRRDFLMLYKTLPQTPLEKAEALEQLRTLEHGYKIRVCLSEEKTLEINTPEELALAQHFAYEI